MTTYNMACWECDRETAIPLDPDGTFTNESARLAGIDPETHICSKCLEQLGEEAEAQDAARQYAHDCWLDSLEIEREPVYAILSLT